MLESLMPWILQLISINQKQQLEITRLKNHTNELKEQLELTKTNTVKQVNEMAKHMANLTDELQCLRHDEHHHQQQQQQINCLSSPSSNDNSSKKISVSHLF
ncbi:unnamed protein product [Trichobilharzia regenti]|nr:unnamed protein product [Trichobilharzia regenti]